MICALFHYAGKLGLKDRLFSPHQPDPAVFSLREEAVTAYSIPIKLPVKPKAAAERLTAALNKSKKLGCRFFALSPRQRRLIAGSDSRLIDGSLYALAFLPRLLDAHCPNWRYLPLTIPLNSGFMAAAARVLAHQGRFLHLYAPPSPEREQLARLIYAESGLICTLGANWPQEGLFIAPPGQQSAAAPWLWQGWQGTAQLPSGECIPIYWGEALLWATLDDEEYQASQGDFLYRLKYLHRLGQRQGLLPRQGVRSRTDEERTG